MTILPYSREVRFAENIPMNSIAKLFINAPNYFSFASDVTIVEVNSVDVSDNKTALLYQIKPAEKRSWGMILCQLSIVIPIIQGIGYLLFRAFNFYPLVRDASSNPSEGTSAAAISQAPTPVITDEEPVAPAISQAATSVIIHEESAAAAIHEAATSVITHEEPIAPAISQAEEPTAAAIPEAATPVITHEEPTAATNENTEEISKGEQGPSEINVESSNH